MIGTSAVERMDLDPSTLPSKWTSLAIALQIEVQRCAIIVEYFYWQVVFTVQLSLFSWRVCVWLPLLMPFLRIFVELSRELTEMRESIQTLSHLWT